MTEKKFLAYYRVSTKKQGLSRYGLDGQKMYVEHFVGQGRIMEEYVEVKSGKDIISRPILQEVIARAKETGWILIVSHTDRLSRSVVDAISILETLEHGQLLCCDLGYVTDRFTFTLFFAFAERERLLIGLRIKAAKVQQRIRGEKPMGCTEDITHKAQLAGGKARAELAQAKHGDLAATFSELQRAGRSLAYISTFANGQKACLPPSGKGVWTPAKVWRVVKKYAA